jgi:membrane-associated phospholipid phosphatase
MLEYLLEWDKFLFHFINLTIKNSFFDFILPYFRHKSFWIPLYLLVLVFLFVKLKWKAIFPIMLFVVSIALTDQMSSNLIKKTVQRIRPCNNPEMQTQLILRATCGSGYSFTSSHAANHFAVAHLFGLILSPLLFATNRKKRKIFIAGCYIWSFLIAFSQVYVGVHYPFDILFGAILGLLLASLTYGLYKYLINKFIEKS